MAGRDAALVGTPQRHLWLQLLALRWPVALASAALVPLALPLPGNPITLAGFFAFIGGAALVSSLRWLILFLPVLAALGPYFLEMYVAGVNLFGFRLLIIILAVFATPLTSRSQWWFNPVARYTAVFMILWIVCGLLSLVWTVDFAGGLTDVMTLIFGLGLILALFSFKCQAPHNLDMLRFGWVFALLVVLAQATWELVTGQRLPSHMTERHADYLDETVIQSTLGEPGSFAAFLLLTIPFLLWSLAQARGAQKLIYVGLLAATALFALYGGARGAFVGLIVELGVWFLILERRWYVRFAAIAVGLVAAVGLANVLTQSDFRLAQKYQRAAELGLEEGSISERLTLTINGIWMAVETAGRGVGAGSYEETTASGEVLIPLRVDNRGKFKPAHNTWVEILAEYGIVPFAGLMVLLGWCARLAWQARRRAGGGGPADPGTVARVLLVALVGFAFYGIQAGSVLGWSPTWMFLASLAVMAAFLYEEGRRPRRAAVRVYGTQMPPAL